MPTTSSCTLVKVTRRRQYKEFFSKWLYLNVPPISKQQKQALCFNLSLRECPNMLVVNRRTEEVAIQARYSSRLIELKIFKLQVSRLIQTSNYEFFAKLQKHSLCFNLSKGHNMIMLCRFLAFKIWKSRSRAQDMSSSASEVWFSESVHFPYQLIPSKLQKQEMRQNLSGGLKAMITLNFSF